MESKVNFYLGLATGLIVCSIFAILFVVFLDNPNVIEPEKQKEPYPPMLETLDMAGEKCVDVIFLRHYACYPDVNMLECPYYSDSVICSSVENLVQAYNSGWPLQGKEQ